MSKEEEEKKRRPIIVETGADDPSTVSPPVVDTVYPDVTPAQPGAPIPDVKGSDLIVGDPMRPYGSRVSGGMDVSTLPPANPNQPPAFQQMPANMVASGGTQLPGETPAPEPKPVVATPAPAPAPVNIGPVITTERTKVSEEAKQGQGDQINTAKNAESIARREGDANADTAKAAADLAANEEKEREIARRQELEDRAREQAKYQAGLAERDRILNDAEKKSHKDYWSDKPAGARLLSVFSSALGEAVAVDTGHNGAQEFIDKELARDDARKQGILKQAIYRAGLKGADAKEAYENGIMEIGLRKAAVLDKLADHRASVLAAKGVPAAQVASDKLVNAAQEKSAKLKTDFGEQLNVKVHSSNELQQKYKMESALQAQKLAGESGKEAGRGITDARVRAQLSNGIKDQTAVANALKSKGVKLSEDDLQQIQDNRTYLDAVRRGDKNTASALATVLERKLGIIPRNEFDGLDSPEKKRLAGALSLMSQKAALLNAGAMTDENIKHSHEQNDLLAPGIGPEERARRWQYMQADLAGANRGMVPATVAAAEKGAEAAGGALGTQPKMSSVDRARLTTWLDKHGDDPRAPAIRASLGR